MSTTRGCPLLVCTVLAGALPGCGRQSVQAADPAAVRRGVELTVYSDDFAQVAEVRPITLDRGENHVPLAEVSDRLDPQSVLLRWSGGSVGPDLVAETCDAGVSSAADVLRRYRGRQIEVVRYGENGREAERQSGTLVSGEYPPVVESNGRLYVGVPGTIAAPVAGDVVTLPHLSVQVDSATRHGGDLQLAYLTRGLSWSADYVAMLSEKTKTMAVECWASVINETGTTYPSAHVTLVAGTPNRAALPARQAAKRPPACPSRTPSPGTTSRSATLLPSPLP